MDKHEKFQGLFLSVLVAASITLTIFLAYTKYFNPFFIELLSRRRDTMRIRNLTSINQLLDEVQKSDSNIFLGEQNKVYISLPSSNPVCADLDLPFLPNGWEYRCRPEAEYRKTDGNGWIPVNFSALPKKSLFPNLPIDPKKNTGSNFYLAYAVQDGWSLIASLESEKYLKQTYLNSDKINPAKFSIGNNRQNSIRTSQIRNYWNFDEINGTTFTDFLDSNYLGIFHGHPSQIDGKMGKALSFDGKQNFIEIPNSLNIEDGEVTYEAWVYPISFEAATHPAIIGEKEAPNGNVALAFNPRPNLTLSWNNGTISNSISFNASEYCNKWHHFVGVLSYPRQFARIYIDGILRSETTSGSFSFKLSDSILIGSSWGLYSWKGYLDEVKIYSRALDEKEISAIYKATN